MICPKCNSSEMWDSRAKKASGQFNPKSPDFKCKNKECGHAIWTPKGEKASPIGADGYMVPDVPFNVPSSAYNVPSSIDRKVEQATKAFNEPKKEVDWDGKDKRIAKLSCLKTAAEIVLADQTSVLSATTLGENTLASMIITVSEQLMQYVYEGE